MMTLKKEEAGIFQAYFYQVIAKFAATDSAPSPSFPFHSRPIKGGTYTNLKHIKKLIVVVTLKIIEISSQSQGSKQNDTLLKPPQKTQLSYAILARSGHKKGRTLVTNNVSPTQFDIEKRPAYKQNSQQSEKTLHK